MGAELESVGAGAGDEVGATVESPGVVVVSVGAGAVEDDELSGVVELGGGTGPMMTFVSVTGACVGGAVVVAWSAAEGAAVSTVPSTPNLIRSSRNRLSIEAFAYQK